MFIRVAEFHRAFGHPVGAVPALPDQAVRDLRISLIKEELGEFCVAWAAKDRVEMADALADLLYVLAGAAVAYGIAPRHEFISPFDDCEPLESMSSDFTATLAEEFAAYLKAEAEDDLYRIEIAVHIMIAEIFLICRQLRIPINAVFAEVHRSNLSKLMPDGSIKRRADGKVLKGPNWSPPAIAAILAQPLQP